MRSYYSLANNFVNNSFSGNWNFSDDFFRNINKNIIRSLHNLFHFHFSFNRNVFLLFLYNLNFNDNFFMDWNFNFSINVVSIFNNIFSWNFNDNIIRNFLSDLYVFGNLFYDLEFSRLLV